jgi:adenosine deaminase
MNFRSLPKIELHLHLDCSPSYAVAHDIDPSITGDDFRRDFIAPAKCANLMDFLSRAPNCIRLMQSEENLRLVTLDVFEQLRDDGVIYAEIRFAPLLHLEQGLSPESVIQAVDEATAEAIRHTGVEGRIILCTLRHYTEEQSLQTARLVEQFKGTRVVALDIAGDEAGYPIGPHLAAFQYAAARGLFCTAHAGEAAGPESVRETLDLLRPSRIGHGVRSVEDPELVDRLIRDRIHLEVSPESNVQTNVCHAYADHPIDRLRGAGVSIGVNTDCRTISDVTLTEEYERVAEAFGWGSEDFLSCNLNALAAAFIPGTVRSNLEERLRRGYAASAEPASRHIYAEQ